jgi:flagellar motor switch protein FliM
MEALPLPAMIAVFKAIEWDNYGLLTVDGPLIYSVVDVLLGGRRSGAPVRTEGRPFTSIERALLERLIRIVLGDMSTAFEPVSKVEFRYERLETNPRFAAIARPSNAAVRFRIKIDIDGRGGLLEILTPYATLEPVRDLLLQMFMGEKFGHDSIWETHLARQLLVTAVELEALLTSRPCRSA